MQIIRNGFIWFDVTKKAREIYESGTFDLYALYDDGTESLIGSPEDLKVCLDFGLDIVIRIGNQLDVLSMMYDFMGHYGKSLSKAYKNIPEQNFNYEQFIVAHFSNLIDQEL
jgi:hypothetical protein